MTREGTLSSAKRIAESSTRNSSSGSVVGQVREREHEERDVV